MREASVFLRLDEFDFEEFLRVALPALEALDPIRALDLLSKKLDRAIRTIGEDALGRYPGSSSVWCRDLDQADPVDGVLAQLARAVAGVAVRASTDEESSEKAFAIVERYEDEIFQRISLYLLAATGQKTQERLNSFFRDQSSVEPSFRGRETASVVRAQFENASEDARLAFQRALELGPIEGDDTGVEESDRQEQLRHWQRRRLLWFRDRLPESLRDIAARVGVTGERPSPEDQGLAEDGFFVGGGGYVGERSPISLEDLGGLNPSQFVEYVIAWRAEASSWTAPTRDGLERILTEYASTQPAEAIQRAQSPVANLHNSGPNVPGYVQAFLSGFRVAGEAGTPVDWPQVIRLVGELLPRIEDEIAREDKNAAHRPWRWLATEVMDIVIAMSRKNLIPLGQADAMWVVVELVIRSASTWEARNDEPFKSFEDVLMASLNTASGRATEALLEVALALFRQGLEVPESDATDVQRDAARAAVVPRLLPLLQHVLAQSGRGAVSALTVVGTYVPQIHLLDRAWMVEAAPALFDKGASQPLNHPAWGGYITRARLFNDVFADLRNWYERAANEVPATLAASTERRDQWSLTQHLAEHVFDAYMRGLVQVDGGDRLVETVFNELPGGERAHISWQVFRSWTDAKRPVRPEVVERLIRFWHWRLDQLIGLPDSESKAKDLEGLTWLICTPYLPDSVVLDLGLQTVQASRGSVGARGAVWDPLERLANVDIDKTFQIAELLIKAALERPYSHITLKQTEAVLTRALNAGSADTRERTRRLINSLGERGYIEFGRLLKEK